jgi:hypothetical protein
MLRGRVAKAMGLERAANPHPAGGAAWRCWDFGFTSRATPDRRWPWAKRRKLAASATAIMPGGAGKVGCGKSIVGPRGAWPKADLDVLRFCTGGSAEPKVVDIALLLDRSEQGVRARRSRLCKAEGRGA